MGAFGSSSRMFAAVVPPAEAVEHLDAFLDVRREAAEAAGLRWADPEQLHVTLAFFATVPERKLEELEEGLDRAAQRRTPFPTRLTGGGAFPDVGRARVVWAGLDLDEPSSTELTRLAAGCRAAATHCGVEVDGARFRPHVTLARMRRQVEVTRWVRLLDSYVGPIWTVDALTLVESHLGQGRAGRPRYVTAAEFALTRPKLSGGSSPCSGSR